MCCFNRERKHCFGSQLNALVPSFLTFWLVCSARTELAKLLYRENEKEELEIELVGLCTDICVVSNALLLKSFLPENRISVDASCCAGVTPESHEAALATMKMCQITIVGE